jgi:hypothetical protein
MMALSYLCVIALVVVVFETFALVFTNHTL